MPSLASLRPASASSIGDVTSWLAVLQSDLAQARGAFQHETQHWEAEVAARPAPRPAPPAAEAWKRLTARLEHEAEQAEKPVEPTPIPLPAAVPATAAVAVAPPPPPPPPPPLAVADIAWYQAAGAQVLGPFDTAQMRARLRDGSCGWDALIWHAAQPAWQPARTTQLAQGAVVPPPPPPPAPPTPPASVAPAGRARYCHECGAAGVPGDRFCAECGTAVRV